MNIQTITMDTRVANIHYKDYRKKVIEHRRERLAEARKKIQEGGRIFRAGRGEVSLIEKEDITLMHSYRALSQGMRIINVESVLRNAKLDAKQMPKLAIGRADWKDCFLAVHSGEFQFSNSRYGEWMYRNKYRYGSLSFPISTFTHNVFNQEWRKNNNYPQLPLKAIVPSIPVHLRPKGELSKYYILWEAEWSYVPPADPILLQHIHGNMYSVLAQWDLTPLEQAVLEGRIG